MSVLSGWKKRKLLMINGITDLQTDYQIKTTVYKKFEPINATGGTITESNGYRIHTFTQNGVFTPSNNGEVEYLVIGGGGGGGATNAGNAGGGGAGGYIESIKSVVAGTPYTVNIGSGGGSYTNGSNSVFDNITALGGGKGGYYNLIAAGVGGSGGGGGQTSGLGAAGTASQGYAGGRSGAVSGYGGGGGGGAGEIGSNSYGTNSREGGYGGDGITSSITGTPITRAGGGAGSSHGSATQGTPQGGLGGGGNGHYGAAAATNGSPNTGGGGGGGGENIATGSGGSGIVIIRYRLQPIIIVESCNDDFTDIRFTKNDGINLLDYFIELFVSGEYAIIWVKIDSIPASPDSTTIYIYYNNPSAASNSNATNTFIYYNDFSAAINFDQFPFGIANNDGFDSTPWSLSSNTLKHTQVHDSNHEAAIKNNTVTNCSIRLRWNLDVLQNIEEIGINFRWGSQGNRYYLRYVYAPSRTRYELMNHALGIATFIGSPFTFSPSASTWYEMEIRVYGTSFNCYHNQDLIISSTDNSLNSGYFGVHGAYNLGVIEYIDNYIVRNFASPEPIVNSSGEEETTTTSVPILGSLFLPIERGITLIGAICGRRKLRNR